VLLVSLVAYLAMPFDFIPVIGQLDDAVPVALALRVVVLAVDASLLREHWPGPVQSLQVIPRISCARA